MLAQVDLGAIKYLTRIATQCRGWTRALQCVTSYYVAVATMSGAGGTHVCSTTGCPHLFTGNDGNDDGDSEEVVTHEFDWPIAARVVRLNPQSWLRKIALRWELYGCDQLN